MQAKSYSVNILEFKFNLISYTDKSFKIIE